MTHTERMNLGSRVSGCVAVSAAALLGIALTGIAGTAHAALPREGASPHVTYQVKTKDPVVFITIDDGIVTSQAALDYVRKHKIPITSFLTSSQVTDSRVRYFERISRWGSIQNHTTTHASLDTSNATLIKNQICPVQVDYRRTFGTKPWMLRPPYGAGPRGATLAAVAAKCKITDIVMWDAVVENGRFGTWHGGPLAKGSIILLHYTSNLATDLKVAVSMARAQGLRPANLADYLTPPEK